MRAWIRPGFSVLAVLVLGLGGVTPSGSATLVVPDQHPTIQAAIDAAAAGDSVWVRAGTYEESLALAGKDLTLLGEGADATFLTTHLTARLLDIGAGVGPHTVIAGIQFLEGRAREGGAIRIGGGASPTIRECSFVRNSVYEADAWSKGGAIHVGSGSTVAIADCRFERNNAFQYLDGNGASGGAIHTEGGSRLSVRRTAFHECGAQGLEGGPGGALYAAGEAEIESCEFRENRGVDGGAIRSHEALTVRHSTFRGNAAGWGAPTIHMESYAALIVEDNTFFDNWSPGGGILFAVAGNALVSRNTLAFNQLGSPWGILEVIENGPVSIDHNVIASNQGIGLVAGLASCGITCNDVWGNSNGNYGGSCGDRTGIDGNISADPIFCNPAVRDLTLRNDSPCAPGASACGRIGALDVGCSITALGIEPPPVAIAALDPVRPNPSRLPVRVSFVVARAATFRLEVLDVAGRRVASLANADFAPGRHECAWTTSAGARIRPGIYLARLEGGGMRETRSFVVLE